MASGGLDICVSSTSFQTNDIGWPQQPPTEKVLKLNMICYNSSPFFFSKRKSKAEFKCLDDSEVLSSDFPGLKTSATSMTSSGLNSLNGLNDLDSLISPKTLLTLLV